MLGGVVKSVLTLLRLCSISATMRSRGVLSVLLLLIVHLQGVLSAKILGVCIILSPSHSLWCYQYLSVLAERGHEITVLGVDEPKIKIPNLKKFIIPHAYDILDNEMDYSSVLDDPWKITLMRGFVKWNHIGTKIVLNSTTLQDLLAQQNTEKPFDLIMFDNACCEPVLGLVHKLGNPPVLLATTYGSPQWTTYRQGNILNPAYVPHMMAPFEQRMTFYERWVNTFYYVMMEYFYYFKFSGQCSDQAREVFGANAPSGAEIAKRANVAIVNHHHTLHDPRPLLPGIIGIAGLHIPEQPRPLPQNLKDSLDAAKDGAILLSFGTNVKSSWLSPDFEDRVLRALEKLPQTVFWKWDKQIQNLPKNVKTSKWLPQGDMMVHPNMKLFITHCGLLSTQEAIYHKLPILALPMFVDQLDNAAMMVRRNLTVQLNPYKLTTDELYNGIQEILTNPMYKRNIEKLGDLMRDMPQTARQQAVFLTEYVIRHQGAPHLRAAAADMPWYQLLLLDVLAVAVFILVTVAWLVVVCLKCVFRTVSGPTKKKRD